ncbi:MAG: GNAT family N-acetyltransferase [Bacilli bacterium]
MNSAQLKRKENPMFSIATDRCCIRYVKENDYVEIKRLFMNEQVRKYLGGVHTDERYNQCFKSMVCSKDDEHYWTVQCKSSEDLIGLISLDSHHDGSCRELSFQFLPSYWGKGYAYETIQVLLKYIATELKIESVVSETQVENEASCKLLKLLGMRIVETVERYGARQNIFEWKSSE